MGAQPLTAKMARALGIHHLNGLMVTRVERGGPSDQKGLRRGDIIIYLGRYQIGRLEDIGSLLEGLRSGQVVRITILRVSGPAIYKLSVHLSAR